MSKPEKRWVKVNGLCRCSECGAMVATTWRWLPSAATWGHAVCEPCVDKLFKWES